jgi:CheY-like chemotaxis protein
MIVEDNPADAKTLRMALARRDPELETIVIEDGEKAIEYFSVPGNCDIQLVLLDLNLPVVSGFEVLEFLKSTEELRILPVVVLSGSSSQEDIERCYQVGANSYISKPAGIEGVFNMANQLVTYWFQQAKLPQRIATVVH